MTSDQHMPSFEVGVFIWLAFALIIIVSTALVLLRMYCATFIVRKINIDDWCALLGYISFVPCFVATGMGIKLSLIARNDSEEEMYRFTDNLSAIFYCFVYLFMKISVLFQYLRLLHTGVKKDYLWWTCWMLICSVVIYYTVDALLIGSICMRRVKDLTKCVGINDCDTCNRGRIASAIFNAATDLMMIILPQAKLWSLGLSRRQKLRAGLVFSIAVVSVFSSIGRLVLAALTGNSDERVTTVLVWGVLTYVELCAILISSCLASIMTLRKAKGRDRGWSRSRAEPNRSERSGRSEFARL